MNAADLSLKVTSVDDVGDLGFAADASDDDVVEHFELHFFYPFTITTEGLRHLGIAPDIKPELLKPDADVEAVFGDVDSHLLFHECLATIPITLKEEASLGKSLHLHRRDTMRRTAFQLKEEDVLLFNVREKSGAVLTVHEAYLRLFSFNFGVLRFAVTSKAPTSVQTVLNVQNAVMRLGDSQEAGRLMILDRAGRTVKPLDPKDFVRDLLQDVVGKENSHWKADTHTDRLFVHTLAQLSGMYDQSEILHAAYNITQMEWKASNRVPDGQLDTFKDKQCYSRFARNDGGLYLCYHADGGATLYFGNKGETAKFPVFAEDRREKRTENVCGTRRPLSSFSLAEAVLFQRTYLRSLDRELHDLILNMKNMRMATAISILQGVHSDLIQFRTKFGTRPVSKSTSCQAQFLQWADVIGLADITTRLNSNIKDLHEFYSNIAGQANQQRLDTLAIVLGFIGIAQLISDTYVGYMGDGPDDDGDYDASLLYVPAIVTALLLVVGCCYIYLTRKF